MELNNNEKNCLLTSDLKVPGEGIILTKVHTSDLENTPAVYAFRCLSNNMHLIGETKNIKHRFLRHKRDATIGKASNKSFQKDFNKYGLEGFELIIFISGEEALLNSTRKAIEKNLQNSLIKHNLCYNTGLSETIKPRPAGLIPSESGVYSILCKSNNSIFIGETAQRQGLNGRKRRSFQRLRQGVESPAIQADFDRYGEGNFQFGVIEAGIEWNDRNKRAEKQIDLIQKYKNLGYTIYNQLISNQKIDPDCDFDLLKKKVISINQTPVAKEKTSKINAGRGNPKLKPVVVDGKVFFSISEAARFYKVNRKVIRVKITSKNPNHHLASPDELNKEIDRRRENLILPVPPSRKKQTTGYEISVTIKGQYYPSLSAAAIALDCSVANISQSIKRGRAGYSLAINNID